jgi:small subunit ribosomal protein S6
MRMRTYELALIADPELDSEALTELEAKLTGWIQTAGGKALKFDRWGKKRLAYPINNRNEGHYFIVQIELPPQASVEIEREMGLSEQVLRYMISSVEIEAE